jgi:hypothetical protein
MNLNSLIIAADASHARLYRTAHPNDAPSQVELIEVDALMRVDASEASANADEGCMQGQARGASNEPTGDARLQAFARRIAERAATFARYHFCNPMIVSATADTYPALRDELARELPHVYVRSVIGDIAQLPAPELLNALSARKMFAPVHYLQRT